jgi:hypothetical protein
VLFPEWPPPFVVAHWNVYQRLLLLLSPTNFNGLNVFRKTKVASKAFFKQAYVSKFRKKDADLLQLKFHGTSLTAPYKTADAFSKHFQSVHSNFCPGFFPIKHSMDVLSLSSVSDSDFTMQKIVCCHRIPSFVIKGCSEIFFPVLKFIYNLSLSQQKYHTLWKQAAAVPVFKGSCPSVSNYIPISILNKLFQSI